LGLGRDYLVVNANTLQGSPEKRLSEEPQQSEAAVWARRAWRGTVFALGLMRSVLRTAWTYLRPPLIAALNILAALIILFEEWGWKPLSDAVSWATRFAPVAALERWIAGLPPYPALLAFCIPAAVLLPFKVLALYLLAGGHAIPAAFVFIMAKLVGTAFLARIFTLTKPSLMQIGWFAAAYEKFVPWKDALYARIRASWVWRYGRMMKTRLRLRANRIWTRSAPRVALWIETSPAIKSLMQRFPALRPAYERLLRRESRACPNGRRHALEPDRPRRNGETVKR
jgi:hypothetical protein